MLNKEKQTSGLVDFYIKAKFAGQARRCHMGIKVWGTQPHKQQRLLRDRVLIETMDKEYIPLYNS